MKLYIGDPCYVMADCYYHNKWGDEEGYKDGDYIFDGYPYQIRGTAYGDGCYEGKHSAYPVDAGCLAFVPEPLWSDKPQCNLGYVVDFDPKTDALEVSRNNEGVISFFINGREVEVVDTDPSEEEEYDDDYDYYDDDDEDEDD